MSDPSMAAGNIASAQADAMRTAAGNENGAMMGFMGMGMAAQASGLNAGNLFQMGQQQQAQAAAQQQQQAQPVQQPQQAPAGGAAPAPSAAGSWTCKCGTTATGKFCPECGTKTEGMKFCPNCGKKLM